MIPQKIFSIAHFEGSNNALHNDTYYQLIKNSSQQFKDEIHDIYFGKPFHYRYNGQKKKYGNPMGVEATNAQVESLFKIQNEFGIDISLTINSIETPQELISDKKLLKDFVAYLKLFYDRGLRSCTLASPHIIRSGILHDKFPDMRWKNTVNHRVANAQQVLDYIFLGYDTIVLDRSLCRNLNELKKIRKAVEPLAK
jgi:collagenase-like PrtC family protease